MFKTICGLLESRRALTDADGPILALYCIAYNRAKKANEKLQEQDEICVYTRLDSNGQPTQVEKPNLWLKVAQDSERQMVACLDRLGLSPLARDKVKPTRLSDEEKPVDPMEKFMQRAPKVLQFKDTEKNREEQIARQNAKEAALEIPGKGVQDPHCTF